MYRGTEMDAYKYVFITACLTALSQRHMIHLIHLIHLIHPIHPIHMIHLTHRHIVVAFE